MPLIRFLIAICAALALSAGALYLYSPARALDVLNNLYPGDGGVQREASAVRYEPGPRGLLDVWTKPSPKGEPAKPVLVFFFGGGWANGSRLDYGFVARAYAARGYVVVLPDYRLVPEVRFPSFVQDAAAAVRWTRDNIATYGGDADRIVVAGHSAGGYLAVMLALDGRYLKAAGADPSVIKAAIGLAGPYDFYPFDKRRSIDAMGKAPDPLATQPITFARADAPPLLLVTGTADTEVRPRNAINLAAREHALGSRTTVLRQYPGLDHNDVIMALSKPFRYKAPLLEESLAFLRDNMPLSQPGKPAR
ncbi:MAG: alpha/beta hydrolase [Novosphingobium sp.]